MNEYPLSIRDVAPSPAATRLTGTKFDGTPDGFHTGGAWLVGDTVWKPLDGRPYANAECHVQTREDEVLELMAGKPLFPRNWRVEEANGRRFLVRKVAHIVEDATELDTDQLLLVEQGVRALNAARWEINDPITLAFDPDTYDLFLVDMSAAQPMTGTGAFAANEEARIHQFFIRAGREGLAKLRQHARHVLTRIEFFEERREGHVHVHGSFSRPIDAMWCKIPDAVFIHTGCPSWDNAMPHTWVVTKAPLSADVMYRYELKYGWSPISYESR